MSKAFVGETDNEEDDERLLFPPLPPGARNYITPEGARRLETERERLLTERAALAPGDLDNDRRRRKLDRRIDFFTSRIDAAQIVDPLQQPPDHVRFGATVRVRNADGQERSWRIVGLDEVDLDQGWISWMSPLASALLEKKSGDTVAFGEQRLTVLKISYR